MIDLHRHSEYSLFDGFGKAGELAQIAKDLGHSAFSTTEHGNTNGLVQHYFACKEVGIKPIMGVEAYFKPKINDQRKSFHLCLFCKSVKGYENLNKLMTIAEKQKYYNPIITLENLKQYHEGIICTSACIASYFSQKILEGSIKQAEKAIKIFKNIFEDDFYIEIQPYKIDKNGTQEKVNEVLMRLADRNEVPCILTSDSHYGKKEDFPTYKKMHEIAKHNIDVESTYKERYMPSERAISKRFIKMHKKYIEANQVNNCETVQEYLGELMDNLDEIENKVDPDILEKLKPELPTFDENLDSFEVLKHHVKKGLKRRGKFTKRYWNRCLKELEVIKHLGFSDYFLIVQDYVNWSKKKGITVGPGRGSGCNSEVDYALAITEVDSIYFDLEFTRFLRMDKKKMPDIDLDFETSRRGEVIQYLLDKYKGHASQICSYGNYQANNLLNDLAKVSGLGTTTDLDKDTIESHKSTIAAIKKILNECTVDKSVDIDQLKKHPDYEFYNNEFDDILYHFTKLYKKVRFIGTHAAGVAITKDDITKYTALKYDKKTDRWFSNYDLNDLEKLGIIKFDILGLKTMESIGECRRLTGHGYDEKMTKDKKIIKAFREGNTSGVFQFERQAARDILALIDTSSFDDIVATNAMNRPGPLSVKMPEHYAENKKNLDLAKNTCYYEYAKETYGTIIYQEQLQQICLNIGGLTWADADVVMKMNKGGIDKYVNIYKKNYNHFKNLFMPHAVNEMGVPEDEALELFNNLFNYTFNKGHGTGYSLISVEEMYFKIYHPNEFWFTKMKYEGDERKLAMFEAEYVQSGHLILPATMNSKAKYSLTTFEDETCIERGISSIKGVGDKAAEEIESHGPYYDKEDMLDRVNRRVVHKGVVAKLEDAGCFETNKNKYYQMIVNTNKALYSKNIRF